MCIQDALGPHLSLDIHLLTSKSRMTHVLAYRYSCSCLFITHDTCEPGGCSRLYAPGGINLSLIELQVKYGDVVAFRRCGLVAVKEESNRGHARHVCNHRRSPCQDPTPSNSLSAPAHAAVIFDACLQENKTKKQESRANMFCSLVKYTVGCLWHRHMAMVSCMK